MYICSQLVQLLMIQCLASGRGTRPFEITIPLHMASLPHASYTQGSFGINTAPICIYCMKTQQQTGKGSTHCSVYTTSTESSQFTVQTALQSAGVGMVGCRGRTGNSQLPTIFLPHQLVCGSYTQSAYTSYGLPGPSAELSLVYPLHDL